jgi:hypothetical protein
MTRVIISVAFGVLLAGNGFVSGAWGAELKPIATQKTKDLVITLLSDSGQRTQGKNTFVLEFTAAGTKKPVDVGTVTLNTVMPMPGMAPIIAGATLEPDQGPGRYAGMISFPDSGARQVPVTWDGPAGKGSTQLSVPVH